MILVGNVESRIYFIYFDKVKMTLELKGSTLLFEWENSAWYNLKKLKNMDLFFWNSDSRICLI
jgi:hypothetical protein